MAASFQKSWASISRSISATRAAAWSRSKIPPELAEFLPTALKSPFFLIQDHESLLSFLLHAAIIIASATAEAAWAKRSPCRE